MTEKVREEYVDAMSAVNYSNGMVKLFFIGQNMGKLAEGVSPEAVPAELRQVVAMPLSGFLYSLSVAENFLKEEKVQELLAKYQEAGLLPAGEPRAEDLAATVTASDKPIEKQKAN